ncbi:DUF7373 family lipoprotein [Nocardia sp. X0981]
MAHRSTRTGNMLPTRPLLALLTAVALAAGSTACGNAIAGRAGPGTTPAAIEELETGLFPTEPADFELTVQTPQDVYALESRRMFEYLVSPHQVDPDLEYLDNTMIIVDGGGVFGTLLPDEFEQISTENYLVSGAITARGNNNVRAGKHMIIALMRFGTEDHARAAAQGFATAADRISPGREKLAIAGHDSALAALTASRDRAQVFAVSGPYVIVGLLAAPADQAPRMGDWIGELLDLQFAALAELTPTPPDSILDLPLDPEGMLRITLPGEYPTSTAFGGPIGSYPPAGHLHFEYDAENLPDYDRYAVDVVARNDAVVYRTGGPEQSFALQTALSRLGDYDEEIAGPPGITDSRCVVRDTAPALFGSHYCVIVYDRYVAVVNGSGVGELADPELYQRTSAQYAILANNR